MRPARTGVFLAVGALLTATTRIATAQVPEPGGAARVDPSAAAPPSLPAPVPLAAPPAEPHEPVELEELVGGQADILTDQGVVSGRLVGFDDDIALVATDDGAWVTVARATLLGARRRTPVDRRDRDRDGVVDVVDACPDEPGSYTGCPERPPGAGVLAGGITLTTLGGLDLVGTFALWTLTVGDMSCGEQVPAPARCGRRQTLLIGATVAGVALLGAGVPLIVVGGRMLHEEALAAGEPAAERRIELRVGAGSAQLRVEF
ncbi:MAG: hypothetical protein IT373_15420 [Polyangiaceae bacterium]|nr:hypothetical protein [Polyangiaceae bacterium]